MLSFLSIVGSLALEEILATWLLLMRFTKWGYLPSQCVTAKCPKVLNLCPKALNLTFVLHSVFHVGQ